MRASSRRAGGARRWGCASAASARISQSGVLGHRPPGPERNPECQIGRLIEPVEIANLCAYLASDLASATTGGALRVDGGFVDNIVL